MGQRPPEPQDVLLAALRRLRRVREATEAELDEAEHELVAALREAGVPWRTIADEAYGTSLQAVRQRFARIGARRAARPRG